MEVGLKIISPSFAGGVMVGARPQSAFARAGEIPPLRRTGLRNPRLYRPWLDHHAMGHRHRLAH